MYKNNYKLKLNKLIALRILIQIYSFQQRNPFPK